MVMDHCDHTEVLDVSLKCWDKCEMKIITNVAGVSLDNMNILYLIVYALFLRVHFYSQL